MTLQMDGRGGGWRGGVSQHPRFFFEKRGNKYSVTGDRSLDRESRVYHAGIQFGISHQP